MVEPVTVLFGPLVLPECRRAVGRGWLIWVRTLLALATVGTALACIWWWWAFQSLDPSFLPFSTFRVGLGTIEGMGIALALVMAPAVLAGSLAGEKERGSMGLLLTTRVDSREIVMGRVAGKLSQIGMILFAGVPGLVLIAALAGIRPLTTFMLFALPLAVTLGCGGIAAAASSMARRGRDALLLVYLIETLLVAVPLIVASLTTGADWIAPLSPFHGIDELSWAEDVGPAMSTVAVWSVLGVGAISIAAWRLRPSCLHLLGGEPKSRRSRRQFRVPPVSEKSPMLWKELYIERVGSVGRVGTVIGVIVILYLFLVSTGLAGLIVWHLVGRPDPSSVDYYTAQFRFWITEQAGYIAILMQLAVGLRAAVAISSERERGTWDGLLTSPLDGREIVRGKLWGNLYALRWLFVAAFFAWSLALCFGAMTPGNYLKLIGDVLFVGAFISACGTRVSLAAPTATKAMAVTMGFWLVGWALAKIFAGIISVTLGVLAFTVWTYAKEYGLTTYANGPFLIIIVTTFGMPIVELVFFFLVTLFVLAESRLRFDRIAGRMAEGQTAVAVDRMLYGEALPPVLLDSPKPPPAANEAKEIHRVHHPDQRAEATADSV